MLLNLQLVYSESKGLCPPYISWNLLPLGSPWVFACWPVQEAEQGPDGHWAGILTCFLTRHVTVCHYLTFRCLWGFKSTYNNCCSSSIVTKTYAVLCTGGYSASRKPLTQNCPLSVAFSGGKQTGCLCVNAPEHREEEGKVIQHSMRKGETLSRFASITASPIYLWKKALLSFLDCETSWPSGGQRAYKLPKDLQRINTVTELQVTGEWRELLVAGPLAGLSMC